MSQTSPPPPPPPPPTAASNNINPTQYWCYHCNKRVNVQTLADVICCGECSNGFVESIPVVPDVDDEEDTPAFGSEFLHILRLIAMAASEPDQPPPPPSDRTPSDGGGGGLGSLSSRAAIAINREDDEPSPPPVRHPDGARRGRGVWVWDSIIQTAREDDEPPPPPSDRPYGDNDYLRIELDRWNNDDNDDNVVDDEEEEEEEEGGDRDQSINNYENDDDLVRRELRFRLHDFASRATSRRNRILDWAEILMGLEDQSGEFRLRVGGGDGYVGDPGDYVDAAGYEALLQTLAESDGGGRRGAPPAAKSAVEGLLTVEVKSSDVEVCAICKDRVFNCEGKVVKQLECGHMYHGECIVCWLESKNSCPVCRFELPTDDPEYEEDRKKRLGTVAAAAAAAAGDRGCSSSSRGAD